METADILSGYPDSLLSFEQSALQNDMPKSKLFSEMLLSYWSKYFAEFLGVSPSDMKVHLLELQNAYLLRNLKQCIHIVNQMPSFPGHPYFHTQSFRVHMNYVRRYFDELNGKKLPRIPFIALPKSASSYVSVVLCRLFDVNPTVLSYRHLIGVPSWAKAFQRFGGVMHDHYPPSEANLKILYEAGINEVVIHNRHPVDALISLAYHWIKESGKSGTLTDDERLLMVNEFCEREMLSRFQFHADWLRRWRAEGEAGRMTLHFTSFEEMKTDKLAFFTRLLRIMKLPYSPRYLQYIIKNTESTKNTTNFNIRRTSTRDWSKILHPKLVMQATKLLADEYADLVY